MKRDERSFDVVFVNEASRTIGMGHLIRDYSMAKELGRRGYRTSSVTIGDGRALAFVQNRARTEGFNWQIDSVSSLSQAADRITALSPAVVVLDCATQARELVQAAVVAGGTAVGLDYFDTRPPLPELIVNLFDHHPDALAGHEPDRAGAMYLEGPEYAIIRDEFGEARAQRVERGEKAKIQAIVIAFGGADPSGNAHRALAFIKTWPGSFSIDLVIGPLCEMDEDRLAGELANDSTMEVHRGVESVSRLLGRGDIVFCGGGGTLLEAMYIGAPTIVMAQNDAEHRHAASLARRNGCWLHGNVDWKEISALENRERIAKRARAVVDGGGVGRICSSIGKILEGRKSNRKTGLAK